MNPTCDAAQSYAAGCGAAREVPSMSDDIYCLFVIFACIVVLAMPRPAQPLFALCAFALALTARFTCDTPPRIAQQRHDRRDGRR